MPPTPPDLIHYQSPSEDSGRWLGFRFRPGDIVISTRRKTGTTWMQMICALLIFQTPELPDSLRHLSPWLDNVGVPPDFLYDQLAEQQHRRFMKTHTPLDGIPLDPQVTFIVTARHPLDTFVSLCRHNEIIGHPPDDAAPPPPEGAGPLPPQGAGLPHPQGAGFPPPLGAGPPPPWGAGPPPHGAGPRPPEGAGFAPPQGAGFPPPPGAGPPPWGAGPPPQGADSRPPAGAGFPPQAGAGAPPPTGHFPGPPMPPQDKDQPPMPHGGQRPSAPPAPPVLSEAAPPAPPMSPEMLHDALLDWIADDDDPRRNPDSLPGVLWHLSVAWSRRGRPNVLLVHYDDLLADLEGQMRLLAGRLGIAVPEDAWPALVEAATLERMRDHAESLIPTPPGVVKDAAAFFRRGSSGAGRELLSDKEMAGYYARAAQLAPPDMLEWLHSPASFAG